jgi:hypothetical protein
MAVILPAPGLAKWLPSNSIGVFLDREACSNCGSAAPYLVVTVYVLAVNVSELSGISAWECSLVTNPAIFPVAATVTLENGGVNALTSPDFDVTLPASVP